MCRWIASMLTALLMVVPLLADGSADEKDNDRAKQFKEIQEGYSKAVPEVNKALEAAKTPKEHEAILKKLNEQFVPRIVKLVEADPKDKLSFDMLLWSVQRLPNVDSKILDLLADHWSKDDIMTKLCQFLLARPNAGSGKLLRKVLADNPDTDARGYACFALAKMAAAKAEDDPKASSEAEKYYERVAKDFAKVRYGKESTLGDQAKAALFEIRHLSVGKEAPNVESETLDGKKVQLKDYKGKVVVLDIWATWCGPCRSMIPHERKMVKKYKDDPFALISVSADDEKDMLKKFLEDNEMPWTHWWDGLNGNIVKGWNIHGFPTIYILDAKGVIRYKFVGARTEELDEPVEKLLAEAKDKK